MNRSLRNTFWVLTVLLGLSPAFAQENDWPRTVPLDEGTVTIYEPQVDEMSDDSLSFRAALAWRDKPGAEPVFGAGWFESDVQVNRLSRTVHPINMKVNQTRFPVEADVQSALSEAMAQPSFASNFTFSLDALEASLKTSKEEALAAEKINTAPPKIIYRDKPALLVTFDGEPVLRDVENSNYEAVINTPYPLIRDGNWYYLNVAEDVWYRADKALGPFRYVDQAPTAIAEMVKQDTKAAGVDSPGATTASIEKITAANAPEIVVSTEPAELLVTEGPAAFVPLVDDLLVLNNSDDDVFMDLEEQAYYIVLAGRWYRSESLKGPWAYQESDRLPDVFTRIPGESEQADSRVYVAGTEEAAEAVLDAQVPQTAVVKRGEADVEVQYDGDPVFAPVDGTDMVYANNTGSTVILADGLYYLIEDGVWYVSTSHNGPWQVSINRPDQVRVIQPSSPVYNVKYVYVYDYTPQVVYTGYTPGYMGSYVYHNTVFYGSGWYYRPWVSPRYYYPRHSTWGFHVNYDPWYGWNFGLSWAWGPFSFSYWPGGYWHHNHYWHHRHYGYWGPHGYRPRHHHHRPAHHRPPGHGRPHPYERHHNLYRDERQAALVANTHDKAPRNNKSLRGNGALPGNAYAKNAYSKNAAVKQKAVSGKTQPVSRSDLAVKAKTQDAGFRSSQKKVVSSSAGKKYSKAYTAKNYGAKAVGNNAVKASAPKMTQNDLAQKAKSRDQGFKSGQNKVVSASGSKSKLVTAPGRSVSQPVAKKTYVKSSQKQMAPSSAGKARSYSKAKSTSVATRTQKQTSLSSASKAGSYEKAKSTQVARRSPKVVTPSSSAKTRSYSQPKSMPVVKLTKPSRSPSSYSKAKQSVAPVTRQQAKPQYSQSSAPRQSAPKKSAAKQAYSAPAKSAPSKSAGYNKSKQRRTK